MGVYSTYYHIIIFQEDHKFTECMECLPAGFKAMVPAILVLTFAWSLKVSSRCTWCKAVRNMMGIRQQASDTSSDNYIRLFAVYAFSTGTS